jgi:two-component sensor histidine kinase
VAAGTLLSVLAVGVAVVVARRIARPIQRLADSSRRMLVGDAAHAAPSSIREVEQLRRALAEGIEKAQAYYRERERAARAEESAKAAAGSAEALRAALAEKESALANNETLLREVHHRVKNNLQMLCDMLYLQMETMEDPEKGLVLRDAYGRIYAIARLHEQLYHSLQSGRVQLAEYLGRLLDGYESLYPSVPVTLETDAADLSIDLDRAIHVGLIVNELVTNALKHAFRDTRGEVRVALRGGVDDIQIEVRDNGKGMTGGPDLEQAKTLGLRIVHILARRLAAAVKLESRRGTTFTIAFPLLADPPVEPQRAAAPARGAADPANECGR